QSNNEDASNALVNDKIKEHIPNQDKITKTNFRKRKERAKKVFKLFNSIGGEKIIDHVKSFFASNISNLRETIALAVVIVQTSYIKGLIFEVDLVEMLKSIGAK
ncbi:1046_t:CDS:2, partial [Gigaspora margarita]